jgi:hypothetical protein
LLLVVGQEWGENTWGGSPTGRLVAYEAPQPGDGWP